MNQIIQLDRYRQAAPQLYEALREQIVTLHLKPGDVLSRVDLAHQFGVSQTPVRDALMKLEQENLVDVYPQAATRVSKIDLRAARRAHFLRRAVELELVHQFAQERNQKVIEGLDLTLKHLRTCEEKQDVKGFMEADRQFHRVLYEQANMMEVWLLLRSRSGHIDRLRQLHLPAKGKMQQIIHDHELIFQAIDEGDSLKAQDALREHLTGTLANADQISQDNPEYF